MNLSWSWCWLFSWTKQTHDICRLSSQIPRNMFGILLYFKKSVDFIACRQWTYISLGAVLQATKCSHVYVLDTWPAARHMLKSATSTPFHTKDQPPLPPSFTSPKLDIFPQMWMVPHESFTLVCRNEMKNMHFLIPRNCKWICKTVQKATWKTKQTLYTNLRFHDRKTIRGYYISLIN